MKNDTTFVRMRSGIQLGDRQTIKDSVYGKCLSDAHGDTDGK